MKKEWNIGLAILRIIMCFMVILCHCWDASNAKGLLFMVQIRSYAVPVFMIMSFMFMQDNLVEHDKEKMKRRFERLLIPQVGWAIIYYVVCGLMDTFFQLNQGYNFQDLLWQIFTGHSFNATMWYQTDLIAITILFLVIIIIFKENSTYVLFILGAFSLFMQYSGLNLYFDDWRFELKYPLGRFFEMLPLAVLGFLISHNKILEKVKKYRYITIGTCMYFLFMLKKYDIFTSMDEFGYGYSGIENIVVSLFFIGLFYCLPFERVSIKFKNTIRILTSYTMGIYCMHRLIASIINVVISILHLNIVTNSFGICILIYIICFVCAWIGMLMLGKTKLRALFD